MAAAAVAVLATVLVSVAPAQAAFPGKNGKIAFARSGQLWTANPDGLGQAPLLDVPGGPENHPAWSPDGRRLAFERQVISAVPQGMWVANADGSDAQQVIGGFAAEPAWAPDGQRIVFSYAAPGASARDLYVIKADGTGLTQLTDTPNVAELEPSWSPDGSKVAFVDIQAGGIWTIDPSGGQRTQILPYGLEPDWSPNGDELAVDHSGILRVTADGTQRTQLTFRGSDPSWSPDGTKIAYENLSPATGRTLNTVAYDASAIAQLARGDASSLHPAWQPIPAPKRSDYKNAPGFCAAERDFLGDAAFAKKYGTNGTGSSAHGKCVSVSH